MDGLIPMMYRVIKRTQTRRKYECLSSGAAQAYNITDFYVTSSAHGTPVNNEYMHGDYKAVGEGKGHHRYNSVGSFMYPRENHGGVGEKKQRKLTKFRSHRMLSCLTGAT